MIIGSIKIRITVILRGWPAMPASTPEENERILAAYFKKYRAK